MKAAPLLKFRNDVAHLAPEGVNVIRGITGNVCPVILIGDGRAGKSYLGSRIVGSEDAFESSDSAESVTEGIDVVAVPVAELLQACGLPGVEDVPPGEHLIVLDCEGGNNAMANIRSLVNVFGIVVGTEVVFVANSMASEQALQNLGATLAARSMIRLDGAAALTEQHLVFAVNKNTLKYQGSALEKILNQQHSDAGRRELRETIGTHFQGSIQKQSPNFLRTLFDKRKQSRLCILRDGHFMWWDEAEIEKKGEAKGCISFIVHRAEVFAGSDPNIFGIRPQSGRQWKHTEEKAFTGKPDREFLFDAEGGEITRDQWVEAIEVHIAFGDGIDRELGEEKCHAIVKTAKPTLKDVEA